MTRIPYRGLCLISALLLLATAGAGSSAGAFDFIEHFQKAMDLFLEQRYEEALPHAQKAVEANDESALAHGLLGNILLFLGQHRDAEQALRRALELEGGAGVPGIHVTLAMAILEGQPATPGGDSAEGIQRTTEALALLDQIAAADQADSDTLTIRGQVLVRLGRSTEAIETYEALYRKDSINYRQMAAGPLFKLYYDETSPGEALERLTQLVHDSRWDPFNAVNGAFTSLYFLGEQELARDLLITYLGTLGPESSAHSMARENQLCDEGLVDEYFASAPPRQEGIIVGGLLLTADCSTRKPEAGSDVTAPVLTRQIPPGYPELARLARKQAVVVLRAVIGKNGKPRDIKVLPNPTLDFEMGFEDAAIEAVRKWRYRPAKVGRKPVEVWYTIFVDFRFS